MLEHTLDIIWQPHKAWKLIREENQSHIQVFLRHVPLLALIPTLAAYYGVTRLGWVVGDGGLVRMTAESAMSLCAIAYVALVAGVFFLGKFVYWMSKTYGVEGDAEIRRNEAFALVVYVTVPVFLSGAIVAYPNLWMNTFFIGIAIGYTVYLIYEGIPILMNLRKAQAYMYSTSVVTASLVVMVTLLISTVVIWGMGIGPVYIDG